MVENRLGWFGHVRRRHVDYVISREIRWRIARPIEVEEELKKLLRKIYRLMS